MNTKILHIGEPIVRFDQDYAFPSSAMSGDISYENWILSNAIQMYFIPSRYKFNISYFYLGLEPNPLPYIPLFEHQCLKMNLIKQSMPSIIDYIKLLINSNYYFTTTVNEYYLSSRPSYLKENFEHGIMVFGYDDIYEEIYSAGYDKTKLFNFHKIKYKDFELAFQNTSRNSRSRSFRRNSLIYELDIWLIKELVNDYINSYNTSLKYRMVQNPLNNCYWGVEACRHIMDNSETNLDERYFYTLFEYSKLMGKRIEKVYKIIDYKDGKELIKENNSLTVKFKNLLSLSIKYNFKTSPVKYLEIKNKLNELLDMEIELLLKFIEVF